MELSKFKTEVSTTLKLIADTREEFAIRETRLLAQEDGLAVREKAVKEIENIVELEQTAKEELRVLGIKQSEFMVAKNNFSEQVQVTRKELEIAATKNTHDRVANENESKSLRELRVALEKEKEDFKTKLSKGLIDLANKN